MATTWEQVGGCKNICEKRQLQSSRQEMIVAGIRLKAAEIERYR